MDYIIKNATLVNEGESFVASVFVSDGKIAKIIREEEMSDPIIEQLLKVVGAVAIDAQGKYLLPGIIDEHVHFREPGLTQKGDIFTESRAAVAGGVTSFMDMPNTNPQTLTQELLQQSLTLLPKNPWPTSLSISVQTIPILTRLGKPTQAKFAASRFSWVPARATCLSTMMKLWNVFSKSRHA